MSAKLLIEEIRAYKPFNDQESSIKYRFLNFIKDNPNCFERSLLIGHITASAWIINSSRTSVLLMHHAKLDKWLQPGGHCDGDDNTFAVVKKEVLEETGIKIYLEKGDIFDLDIHTIPARKEVPEHEHFDIRYKFEVADDVSFTKNSESNALKWIPISEMHFYTKEESIIRMFQKSLN